MNIESNASLPPRPDDIDSRWNRAIAAENERVRADPKKQSWFSRHPVWTVILILVAVASVGSSIVEASQPRTPSITPNINRPVFTASDGTTLSSAEVAGIDVGWDQQTYGRQRLICDALQNPVQRAAMNDAAASQIAQYDISPDEVEAMFEYIDQEYC